MRFFANTLFNASIMTIFQPVVSLILAKYESVMTRNIRIGDFMIVSWLGRVYNLHESKGEGEVKNIFSPQPIIQRYLLELSSI
jgi:hypothetical protein